MSSQPIKQKILAALGSTFVQTLGADHASMFQANQNLAQRPPMVNLEVLNLFLSVKFQAHLRCLHIEF